jgi:RecJ-like exonuclease
MGARTDMDNDFDPEKYGMLFCLECNGNGKLLSDSEDIEICPKCGGFGFIKKENSKSIINKPQENRSRLSALRNTECLSKPPFSKIPQI